MAFRQKACSLPSREKAASFEHLDFVVEAFHTAVEFPLQAAIEDLGLSPERDLERRNIFEVAQGNWIHKHHPLIISGPMGRGKSFLVCAFGTVAIRPGFSVRYFLTSRLLYQLTQTRQTGSYSNLLRSLARTDLVILDNWMRDTLTVLNAQDLLEILDDRFGHSSTLIASQVPSSEWYLRIPDPTVADAILDHLVHNAYRLNLKGESQRKPHAIRSMPIS